MIEPASNRAPVRNGPGSGSGRVRVRGGPGSGSGSGPRLGRFAIPGSGSGFPRFGVRAGFLPTAFPVRHSLSCCCTAWPSPEQPSPGQPGPELGQARLGFCCCWGPAAGRARFGFGVGLVRGSRPVRDEGLAGSEAGFGFGEAPVRVRGGFGFGGPGSRRVRGSRFAGSGPVRTT